LVILEEGRRWKVDGGRWRVEGRRWGVKGKENYKASDVSRGLWTVDHRLWTYKHKEKKNDQPQGDHHELTLNKKFLTVAV
jgi:hypothetical protein